ncbi:hypothetical protein ACFE04_002694 [Oxalis oulophora]
MEEEIAIEKLSISGTTLASLIQRLSSSPNDIDGLLFGHVTQLTPSTLSDDTATSSSSHESSSNLIATITSFFCSSSTLTFYDPLGNLNHHQHLLHLHRYNDHRNSLLGWFTSRRKTPLRPSMREFSVTKGLSSPNSKSVNILRNVAFRPSIFILFATPLHDQAIHTHDYRAYQFASLTERFEAKSIDIVNIGPAFRGHYGNFVPINSMLPLMSCEVTKKKGTSEEAMNEDVKDEVEQEMLDSCVEGFRVGNLGKLMGVEPANYAGQVEDLYAKMLVKIETLARVVEASEAEIHKQEDHNRTLRTNVAKLTGSE